MRSPTELRPALSTACASEMLAFRIWSKSSNFTLSMLFRSNTPAPGSCESVNARNQNSRHLGFGVFGYPPKTCVRKNLITHAGPRLKPCRLSPPPLQLIGMNFGGISMTWVYCLQLELSSLPAHSGHWLLGQSLQCSLPKPDIRAQLSILVALSTGNERTANCSPLTVSL